MIPERNYEAAGYVSEDVYDTVIRACNILAHNYDWTTLKGVDVLMMKREFEIHVFSPRGESVVWVEHTRFALRFFLNNCCHGGEFYQVYSLDNRTGQKEFISEGRARSCRAPLRSRRGLRSSLCGRNMDWK